MTLPHPSPLPQAGKGASPALRARPKYESLPMPITAILFDKDGTLISFEKTWGPALLDVMRAMSGGDAAAFARLVALNHFDVASVSFLPTSPLIAGSSTSYGPDWARVLGRSDLDAVKAELDQRFHAAGLRHLTPLGEPAPVLKALAAHGLHLGIATNDSERAARAQADVLGLIPHLTFVAGYDSGHGAKPGPGMVQAFARQCGCVPGSVAMVGDSLHDLQAARAAGAVAVAVLSGPASRGELEPHADVVLGGIGELAEWVVNSAQ